MTDMMKSQFYLGTVMIYPPYHTVPMWVHCLFYGDRLENIHFWSKPRHVTPQIYCLRKQKEHSWENMNFSTKPRYMTLQIDHLEEMSTVLRVSTHICGVSMEIDGKTFILGVNLGMWPLKSIVLEKQALFWGSGHTFMGFWGDRWENIHF